MTKMSYRSTYHFTRRTAFWVLAASVLLLTAPGMMVGAQAGEADVIAAKVNKTLRGTYNFDVTIRSNDKGWNYYCDRFEVLSMDGKLLGARTLFHPHETEQPFTRDLHNVRIPPGTKQVKIRARMKPNGYDGKVLTVKISD